MSGEHIIQECTKLRGRGYQEQAIACIVNNIEKISPDLRATAWNEASMAAQALGDELRQKSFKRKSEALYCPREIGTEVLESPQSASSSR